MLYKFLQDSYKRKKFLKEEALLLQIKSVKKLDFHSYSKYLTSKTKNLFNFEDLKKKKLLQKNHVYLYIWLLKMYKVYWFLNFKVLTRNLFNFGLCRIKNRCISSNRAKSVYRFFHFSRMVFRECVKKDFLSGLQQSSW